jgi:serine/threonine-protein kinase
VDRRADVYGLGATVFALRYGAPPFGPLDLRRPDRVAAFPAARGPEEAYFQHVVARMLAYRPEERYPHLATAGRHLASIARATRPRATPARVSTFEFHFLGTRILFDVGDIAEVDGVDAVVSSANHKMTMRTGGGDALRRRGGDAIEVEAMQGGERALGDCVLTTAGSLALRGIVHAVAAWNEVSTVARATQRALLLAEEHGFRRLAVPALGSGQGRVALEACADAMVATLAAHLSLGGSRLEEVRFVLVDEAARARVLEVAAGILLGGGDGLAGHEDDAATVTTSDSFASTLFGSSTK